MACRLAHVLHRLRSRSRPQLQPPAPSLHAASARRLPLHWAFALWTAGSLAAGAVTIRVMTREVAERWPAQDLRVLAAAALTGAGVAATIRMGQVSLYLALVVTLAWKAARHGEWGIEGVWLGLAISLKPFLLLMAPLLLLRKQGRATAVALLTASICLSAGVLVFGRAQFEGWIGLLRRPAPVEHLQFFLNGSWSGFRSERTSLGRRGDGWFRRGRGIDPCNSAQRQRGPRVVARHFGSAAGLASRWNLLRAAHDGAARSSRSGPSTPAMGMVFVAALCVPARGS